MSSARKQPPAELGAAIVLAIALAYFSWQAPDFHTAANWRLITKQSAQLAIVSVGMTLVIATGGIDLSVGSVLGLCAMVLASLCGRAGWPLLPACAAAIACGGLCGLLNGALIAKVRLPPIIVTLATYAAARAATSLFNNGNSVSGVPAALTDTIGATDLAGLPLLFWLGLLALIAGAVVLRTSSFGRILLAMGGNRAACRLAGVPVVRAETLVYTLNGALAGLASVVNVALAATAAPSAGLYLEFEAITAVILGGAIVTGGKASMMGTALGVLTINVLVSGGRLMGHEDQIARFMLGAALLLAVEIQNSRSRPSQSPGRLTAGS